MVLIFTRVPRCNSLTPFQVSMLSSVRVLLCEQVQNNHDAINCQLGSWSQCLKNNQYLSAGYMIRKLVVTTHAWLQKVVSVEKLFQSGSYLQICIQSCLITRFILSHCCWQFENVTTQSSGAYWGGFSSVHFTASHLLTQWPGTCVCWTFFKVEECCLEKWDNYMCSIPFHSAFVTHLTPLFLSVSFGVFF